MLANNRRHGEIALAVLIVVLMAGSAWSGGPWARPSSAAPASPGASHATPGVVGSAARPNAEQNYRSAHLMPANIRPAQPVCLPNTQVLPYTAIASGPTVFWPLYPAGAEQSPCTIAWYSNTYGQIGPFNDELHMTFSSPVAGSASRWTVPIHLPAQGPVGLQLFANDFYVGMVVKGDPSSLYNESYLQAVFTPSSSANTTYNVSLSVLAFHVGSDTVGSCQPPYWGLNVSWNGLYACELEMLGNGAGVRLKSYVPADQWYNITFNGADPNGLTVYANDTTNKSYTASPYQLSVKNTGFAWQSMFRSSCEDLCYLNWSLPFGNGFGLDLGGTTVDGFNTTVQDGINPVEIGSPEYYTSSGYTGDFANISMESGSGGCSGVSSYTINCNPLPSFQGFQYPYFQFNGTVLNIGNGQDYPWTTEDFNQYYQFESHGNPNDTVPFWLDQLTNSSAAGFVGPNASLTLTIRAQDLGTVTGLVLNYTQPGGGEGSVAMTRINGTSSIGYYQGIIPSNGHNGLLAYYIVGTNHAGEKIRVPAHNALTVQREVLPKFYVDFLDTPSGGGSLWLNGTIYPNRATVGLTAGYYPGRCDASYPYVFLRWIATGVGVDNTRSCVIRLEVKENGTLDAVYKYVRPTDHINLQIDTNKCGAILLNGSTYTTNQTVHMLDSLRVPLSYAACAQNTFSGWVVSNSTNVSILGGTPSSWLTLYGNGTVTLTFIPSSEAIALVLQVHPPNCGGILFRGAGYTNNISIGVLPNVAYPVAPDACAHYGLLNWTTTAGLALTGSAASGWSLKLVAPGTLSVIYYHLTEVTIETLPGYCGAVNWSSHIYYNGTVLIVDNGSAYVVDAIPCAGFYFRGWYTTGGVAARGAAVTVTGSGILEAVFGQGKPTDFVAFITDPTTCGEINFDGTNYSGSGYVHVPLNFSGALNAYPCAGYGFVGWVVGGLGITITGPRVASTTVYVNGSGSITAHFHPLVPLYLYTTPATCGQIIVNGQSYPDGSEVTIPAPNTYSVGVSPCANFDFLYWLPSSGISLGNGSMNLQSAARLTAVFGPVTYHVVLNVAPGDCGGIKIGPDQYVNNTTIGEPFGNYTIVATPCSGFHLVGWTIENLNLSNRSTNPGLIVREAGNGRYVLTIQGSGRIVANYLPVPPVVSIELPSSTAIGWSVSMSAVVQTLVPPYTYTYVWNFGDGTSATTAANFTTHTYTTVGTYLVSVTVHDPYDRNATANATVQVLKSPPGSSTSLTLTAALAIVIGVVAVLAAVLLALRTGRAPPEATTAEHSEPRPEEDPARRTEP
jgi:hypothetical protein